MNIKITMIVEVEEEGNIIFQQSTSAGMADFEENIVRKGESAIKEYYSRAEVLENEQEEE